MISYLLLGLSALVPGALRRYEGMWRASPPYEGQTGFFVWGACVLTMVWVGKTAFVSWPVAVAWLAVTVAGYVYGERAMGVPKQRPVDTKARAREALETMVRDERREIDRVGALVIGVGVTFALLTLPQALGPVLEGKGWSVRQLAFPLAAGMTVCGVGLKHGRRHAWTAAVCVAGMAVWIPEEVPPTGRRTWVVVLMGYGFLLWQLMRVRKSYYTGLEARREGDEDGSGGPERNGRAGGILIEGRENAGTEVSGME